jgi:oxygen-independent coproporphyrinogen-3 oxidase
MKRVPDSPLGHGPVGDRRAVTLDLLRKYDRPGPRYTSYPTAVEFNQAFDHEAYRERLAGAGRRTDDPLSLYLHLPFCQERCTFCGCMVIITRKREVAAKYLEYLHREIAMLAEVLGERRRVVQYHWGGGTPTYLAPAQMNVLHSVVSRHFDIAPDAEVAIEVDPRVTTTEHIDTLASLGFNRLSLGVQDFTPEVQEAVNRVQSGESTRDLVEYARRVGFHSINIDLIYGLPLQTVASFARSIDTVIGMRPGRVAVYSFAHVPWIRGNQKQIRPEDLPPAEQKLQLFIEARERFLASGYRQIGMDHFALPEDELSIAQTDGRLYRNFMGYTVMPAADQIGIGVSSIGDVRGAFAQNGKKLSTYYEAIDGGRLPVERGYALDQDDIIRRHVITELMCNSRLDTAGVERRFAVAFDDYFRVEREELAAGPVNHGFLEMNDSGLEITPLGRLFVRNICMTFDRYLRAKTAGQPVFSRTV